MELNRNPKKGDLFPDDACLALIRATDDAQLAKGDLFLKHLSAGVPRLYTRLEVLETMLSFGDRLRFIANQAKAVTDACSTVLESIRGGMLRKLLEFVLGVGNYLNSGNQWGGSWGFPVLNTLEKLQHRQTHT